RQPADVYINDSRIRSAERLPLLQRFAIDLLRQFQSLAARFRQPDQLFQPGGSRRLEMQPGIEMPDRLPDRRIERELIAAGMDAQFQTRWQPISADRIGNDG